MRIAIVKAVVSSLLFTTALWVGLWILRTVVVGLSHPDPEPLVDLGVWFDLLALAYLAAAIGAGYLLAALLSLRACRRIASQRLFTASLIAAVGGSLCWGVLLWLEEPVEAALTLVLPRGLQVLIVPCIGLILGLVSIRAAARQEEK